MSHAPSLRRLTLGALLAGAALVAVPAAANADPRYCTYNPTTKVLTISGGFVEPLSIFRSGQSIAFRRNSGLGIDTGTCASATVTNTDRIDVVGAATSTGNFAGFVIDQSQGAFAPGATPENDGHPEIEISVRQQVANPAHLQFVGTPQDDTVRVGGGNTFSKIMLGPDADNDLTYSRTDGGQAATRIDVNGAGGNDFITGRGGFGVSSLPAATVPVGFHGGSGDDTLVDGVFNSGSFFTFPDVLRGETGNDTLFSVDGRTDSVDGGDGFDNATVDAGDNRVAVEQLTLGSVGRLRLDHAAVHARAGGVARIGMRWTHPKDWRKLRKLELRLVRGTERVGRVVVTPATDTLRAHGRLALAAGSRVDHQGKTVTAKLAVRLPKSLTRGQLRVEVEATDRRGRTQLEPAAGTIAVR